jgi:hypothetical protein
LLINIGRKVNYLGMIFDYTTNGKMSITIDGFVEELLRYTDIDGEANTPATTSLFKVDERRAWRSVKG